MASVSMEPNPIGLGERARIVAMYLPPWSQWSRIRSDSESKIAGLEASKVYVSQWSRIRSDSESRVMQTRPMESARLNGAESDRTRRAVLKTVRPVLSKVSMEPNPIGLGECGVGQPLFRVDVVSMEPNPIGLGEGALLTAAKVDFSVSMEPNPIGLGESNDLEAQAKAELSLNGAESDRTRRADLTQARSLSADRVSMEPNPIGLGESMAYGGRDFKGLDGLLRASRKSGSSTRVAKASCAGLSARKGRNFQRASVRERLECIIHRKGAERKGRARCRGRG